MMLRLGSTSWSNRLMDDFTTKYLASFVGEDYRQAMAISLGIVAVAISYKMMGVIEGDKDSVIEETERMANRLMDSIRKDLD